ncbi:TPA: TrmB family transcriptional regulator [Methanosarcina acetivorans]|uniref:Transcription regulator TrmB N-terminal domain-containing protein n=2 Tax=Methanosarcina acetivorans TaxID=2214 RepID=Q8TTR7_METAC|nr:TrmB family transcriptional regulator [Methanosarcina acetivorans]AAM03811.1 conserved hypothetical protein [Methanosarcina acetivorans C2A]HIH93319.1 TrmB family transcriptional regulator [Methanosarcina acetivorans]
MTLKIIDNLQKLGFTENEAKIYSVLVCLKKANAREIFEASGVPRSKIYKVLRRMEEKGYVQIIDGQPTCYRAKEPEELISRIRDDLILSLAETSSELKVLSLECGACDVGNSSRYHGKVRRLVWA